MSHFHLTTLGCKVNQSESRQLSEQLSKLGWKYTLSPQKATIIIINTCLVTNIAERKSRQIIRQFQKSNPQAKIYICGCYANLKDNDLAKEFKEVTIIPKDLKLDINQWPLPQLVPSSKAEDIFRKNHLRDFIKVEDGCDQFCSYCIIPYARGAVTAVEPHKIMTEVDNLINKGIKEVALTGINIGKYNYQETNLTDLLRAISKKDLLRIRLSSIEPNLVSDGLLSLIQETPNIMPHLHIPLQSGSAQILKDMNRPYSKEYYQALIERVKSAHINITTDLIVGFPTETAETLQETEEFLTSLEVYDIHAFKYSPREGTKAYQLKSRLKGTEIEAGLQRILALKKELQQKYIRNRKSFEVFFEQQKDNYWQGLSQDYVRIHLESDQQLMGQTLQVKLKEIDSQGRAIAELTS